MVGKDVDLQIDSNDFRRATLYDTTKISVHQLLDSFNLFLEAMDHIDPNRQYGRPDFRTFTLFYSFFTNFLNEKEKEANRTVRSLKRRIEDLKTDLASYYDD